MRCGKCGNDNREGRKFCAKCAAPLARLCPQCGASNEPGEDFCGECAAALAQPPVAPAKKFGHALIPVAEAPSSEIIEGERKTVTALFADIKGSTDTMEGLDPEEARHIIDPALKLMIDAVARYTVTSSSPPAMGFSRFSVRHSLMRTIRIALFTPHSECRKNYGATATICSQTAARRWKSGLV
jgi:class 3 adenylate cyclase